MNNESKGKKIAFFGVSTALILVFLIIETEALNGILPVTPCYISLPFAISLSAYSGKKSGVFIGGTIFGVCSFILSFIFGQQWFFNPLISVLPRVIFGITSGFTFIALNKLCSKSHNKFIKNVLPASVCGIVGAVTNTVLVVLGFFLFGWQDLQNALTTILSFNALIEICCSAFFVPVFVKTARRFYRIGGEK